MIKFKNFFMLNERIEKTDIIDLYIIMAMPDPEDPKYKFIQDEVINKVSGNIKSEIENILLRELRHASSETYYPDDESEEKRRAKRIIPGVTYDEIANSINWLSDHWSFNRETSIQQFAQKTKVPWTIDGVINAFKYMRWSGGYGGRSWAKIAEHAKALLTAYGGELIKQLDRFVDYVHNTGAVMNKFKGYEQGWLKFILDLKAQSQNIRELIPYATHDVRQLFKDPAWHLTMMNDARPGAEESDKIIVDMFKKYIVDAVKATREGMWTTTKDDLGFSVDKGEQAQMGINNIVKNYTVARITNALINATKTNAELIKVIRYFTRLQEQDIMEAPPKVRQLKRQLQNVFGPKVRY